METALVNSPKFIYKEGKAVEVIIDIETYIKFKKFIDENEKKTENSFTIINGVTIIRSGSLKTGKDIAKQAHTRSYMKDALKSLNK